MQLKIKILGVCLILLFCLILPVSSCSQSDEIRSLPKNVYISEANDYVSFEGRWKKISETGATKIPKINGVECNCFRERLICKEYIAKLYLPNDNNPYVKNILYPQLVEYRIIEWSPILIRAINEAPVADFELRISIPDKNVERSYRETKSRGSDTANPDIAGHWILK